jgi:hypothetical protein
VAELRVPLLLVGGFSAGGGLVAVVVEVAADPVLELPAAAVGGDEDGVVHADQAAAAIHELAEVRKAVAVQERVGLLVAVGAVAEEEDGVGVCEDLRVLRPAVEHDFGFHVLHVRRRVEAVLEQAHALLVLMLAWAVALLAGDEYDLPLLLLAIRRPQSFLRFRLAATGF